MLDLFFELFSDEWLPMAALHYRWNYKGNYDFIIGEFGKNAIPYAPKLVQRAIAKRFANQMSGYLPILGITKKMEPALEETVEELLSLLNEHFRQYPFLLGERPTIGDFALYGPLYAHLERDPEPADLIKKHHHLHNWLMTMNSSFSNIQGNLVANDQIPESLLPVLRLMAELHGPLLLQTLNAVTQWSEKNPNIEKLPQRLGNADIKMTGKTEIRYNLTYAYWMIQRLQERVAARSGADTFIESLGLASTFSQPLKLRVNLKKARLYRA